MNKKFENGENLTEGPVASTQQLCLLLAWLIALLAMGTTLYASEVLHYPVCKLCWYQRICLYPLVLILGIGAYRNEKAAIRYALPLSLLGSGIACYQYLLQMIPGWEGLGVCGAGPNCADIHLKIFGVITFPLLSFLVFLALSVTLFLTRWGSQTR